MVKIEKAYVYILNEEDGSIREYNATVWDFRDKNNESVRKILGWDNESCFMLIDYDPEGIPFDLCWHRGGPIVSGKGTGLWLSERDDENAKKTFDEYYADLDKDVSEERRMLLSQSIEYGHIRTGIRTIGIVSGED